MDTDRLNRWLALGANVAVLAGLVALVLEIRTNTAAIHATSVQEITSGTREALLTVASNKELSRIVRIGQVDRSALDEDEAHRFSLFSRQRWLFFQGIWMQRRLGVLDDQVWGAYERSAPYYGTKLEIGKSGQITPEYLILNLSGWLRPAQTST